MTTSWITKKKKQYITRKSAKPKGSGVEDTSGKTLWITKKEKPKYITKKEKPKSWITKKAEPKSKSTKSTKWSPARKLPWKPTKKPLSIRQAVKDVVAEGGSPKLTTDEARMSRIDKKLGIIPADDHPIKDKNFKNKNFKKGGRAGFQHGGRTRLLEELGRVEAEPSNRNRRAEVSRIHSELNRGYKGGGRTKKAKGGRIGLQHGSRPRPSGPHTWVKSGGAVLKGKKVGIQIK